MKYNHKCKYILIREWIFCDFFFQTGKISISRIEQLQLAQQGNRNSWLTEIVESLFLTVRPTSCKLFLTNIALKKIIIRMQKKSFFFNICGGIISLSKIWACSCTQANDGPAFEEANLKINNVNNSHYE